VGDGAEIYNPARVKLGDRCIVSQGAYLCTASHDYNDPNFTLISSPIEIGPKAWICAKATVQMGVTVGEGAVLALGGIATKTLEAWTVYGGIPAKPIDKRTPF
jgi:putative colanic acid biosynthesis acetyltransferase WcaF